MWRDSHVVQRVASRSRIGRAYLSAVFLMVVNSVMTLISSRNKLGIIQGKECIFVAIHDVFFSYISIFKTAPFLFALLYLYSLPMVDVQSIISLCFAVDVCLLVVERWCAKWNFYN